MFGIDDAFLLAFLEAAPEAAAAIEGTTAAATAAETAAAAEAATAATQAAAATQATEAANGIMQASPDVAALGQNQVVAVQAEPTNFIDQPLSLTEQYSQYGAGKPVGMNTPPSSLAQQYSQYGAGKPVGMNNPPFSSPTLDAWEASGKYEGPSQLDAWEAKYNNMGSNFAPDQSFGPGLGTQPGGPYDTSRFSNALGGDLNNPTGLQQFASPAPTTGAPSGVMPASVPGAEAPMAAQPTPGYLQYNEATGAYGGETESSLMKGFNAVSNWAEKHPYQAAGLGYMAYSKLNQPEPYKPEAYSGPLSKFKISPNFQGRQANPQDFQYTPRKYASGGITDIHSYAKGKLTADDNVDVGIYRDTDPDTAHLDPLTAAMVRQSKLDKRNYVNTKAKFNKPTPMGTLNFDPVAGAAQGGIMGASNLGGYAAGGNPRLLRGPGDGMSDNIPATINNRQPARLADGEFVVPADVVSHLGNGSTEAGAKKLHEMMNKVRKERTGKTAQPKAIGGKISL